MFTSPSKDRAIGIFMGYMTGIGEWERFEDNLNDIIENAIDPDSYDYDDEDMDRTEEIAVYDETIDMIEHFIYSNGIVGYDDFLSGNITKSAADFLDMIKYLYINEEVDPVYYR